MITPVTCGQFFWRRREKPLTYFKKFKALVEQETSSTIKTLRTDRAGEFTSFEFQLYCKKSGIQRHLTTPSTPQHNGVVERWNWTVLEMTRSILKHKNLRNYLWAEAARHTTYRINKVTTRVLNSHKPYEAFQNNKLNVKHLRVFGCIGCVFATSKKTRWQIENFGASTNWTTFKNI